MPRIFDNIDLSPLATCSSGYALSFGQGGLLRRLLQSAWLEAAGLPYPPVGRRRGPLLPSAGRNAARAAKGAAGDDEPERVYRPAPVISPGRISNMTRGEG